MKYFVSFLLVGAFLIGCNNDENGASSIVNPPDLETANQVDSNAKEFFVKWLEGHGHDDVIIDQRGVGVGSNQTRLKASLYGSKQHETGGFMAEVELDVKLPSGRSIKEFVAGLGETEDAAIADALLNFTLTTFHVVYKGFINNDDPHMKSEPITIDGSERELIAGDLYLRGSNSEELDFDSMQPKINSALATLQLDSQPHWVKIVYSQMNGTPGTVAVTLDNQLHEGLTDQVTKMEWPESEFYMVKQFLLIQ